MQHYKKEITFIHTADLHLGSPFTGISEKDRGLADYLNRSIFQSFDTIIETCLSKKADFLLIAGDIFDSREKNLRALRHFIQKLSQLKEQNIPVIITTGNHDPLQGGPATSTIWDYIADLSGHNPPFTLIQSDSGQQIDIIQSGEVIARICGVSFRQQHVTCNPVQQFPIRSDTSIPWIGLVHCTIGSHSDHIPYAPLSITDLIPFSYDYWALGHIHAGYTVRTSNPVIVYPGNIQGRNRGETGPRGCICTTIRTDGSVHTEFCETAPVRFETRELSISGMEQAEELISVVDTQMQEIQAGLKNRSAIVTIALAGSGPLWYPLVRTSLIPEILERWQDYNPSPPFCTLTQVLNQTTPPIDRESLRGTGDIFDVICSRSDELAHEPGMAHTRTLISPLFAHAGARHILGDITDEYLQTLIRKAEEHILVHLGAGHED